MGFYDSFKVKDKSSVKLYFEIKTSLEVMNADLLGKLLKLAAEMNNIDRDGNIAAIHNLSESNRSKFHSKSEDQKKKEELSTKIRTDKELELYNKRRMKKHTKMVK